MIKNIFLIKMLLLISLLFTKEDSFAKEVVFRLDNFDKGNIINTLGGASGTFDKDPTKKDEYCKITFVEKLGKNDVYVLKLEYKVSQEGFNGFFTKLNNFDLRPYQKIILNLSANPKISKLKLELKGDDSIGVCVLENLDRRPRKFVIPIEDFKGLKRRDKIKEFVIVFDGSLLGDAEGELVVESISFASEKGYYDYIISQIEKKLKENIIFIKNLSNDELLDFIQRKTFDYFITEVGEKTGFVKDRSTEDSPSSIAATGFGLAAICIGVERKWISYEKGKEIILKTLRATLEIKDAKEGFYYHFVDKDTGKRVWQSELSSIDTALLLGGVIVAREYFNDVEIKTLADRIISRVNWLFMMDPKTGLLYMGWDPENGFSKYPLWDTYAEMLMMYILGLGAEKNYLPEISWHNIKRPIRNYKNYSYISSPGESMFVYQYSHAFVDFRNISDKYTNYWDNSLKAILRGYEFCKDMSDRSKTYKKYWGISASDGPFGYKNYGATIFAQDGTIAPYAICASVPFLGEIAIKTLREMMLEFGSKVFGKYGFVSAINLDYNYFSDDFIGIDLGITILMIENYRTEFVWKQFMKNDIVKRGLKRAGFKPGKSEVDLNTLMQQTKGSQFDIELKSLEVKNKGLKNIVIDGDLSEWNEKSFYQFDLEKDLEYGTIRNDSDLSAKFNFYWDEKNLYFAIKVVDDIIIDEHSGKEIYLNDCVELYFNPYEKILYWGDKKNFQIGFSATKGVDRTSSYSWFQDENPVLRNKVKFVSKKADNGYIIEASISLDYLGISAERKEEFGFSVAVHDIDDKDNKTDKKINFSFKNVDDRLYLGAMKLVN